MFSLQVFLQNSTVVAFLYYISHIRIKTLGQQIKKTLKSYICWKKVKGRFCFAWWNFTKTNHRTMMKIRCFSGSLYPSYKKLNPSHVLTVIPDSIVLKHFGESFKMKGPVWFSLCSSKVQKQKSHVAVFKPKLESFTHLRAFVLKRSSSGCSRLSSSRTT